MSNQRWLEPWMSIAGDGPALTASITATSLLPTASSKFIIPSAFFEYLDGKTLQLRATGRISTVVTTPGTLTLAFMLGAIGAFSSGAIPLNTTAQTNVAWILEAEMVIRSLGAGTLATLFTQGTFKSHAVIGSPAPTAGGAGVCMLPYNTAPAAGSGFDSSQAQAVDLFGTWSINNANSIQLHTMKLISLN